MKYSKPYVQSIFWLILIFMTGVFLGPDNYFTNQIFNWWDKAQHALAFGVLMVLGAIAYAKKTAYVFIGLMIYGASIEFLQYKSGWRHGDLFDWFADVVGLIVAWALLRLYQRHFTCLVTD